jgi:site-specific recombinase XerD
MFDTLYSQPAARRRHWEGPLAAERAAYLEGIAAQGAAFGTLLRRARYWLCVALEVAHQPADHLFDAVEVDDLAAAWAARRISEGRARGSRWPEAHFRFAASDFLRAAGKLRPTPAPAPGRYATQLDEFIAAQGEGRWQSGVTRRSGRWQIGRFLTFLDQQGTALENLEAPHVDAYFRYMASRWGRVSLHTSGKALRAWFAYCESRGWVRPGLAGAVMVGRVYRQEGVPLGPTWEEVGRMLAMASGEQPVQLRDQAILRLLAVYGLRSGEVRRLRIEDLDWQRERIHIVRSKSGRTQWLPLEPSVGCAIARYLRWGRPTSRSRRVFLTLPAPHRPLSAGGLYDIVRRHMSGPGSPSKGRGPHGLRHACARRLIESGRSFKEVGDHLGHRSTSATRIYAKIDLASLRRVALDDLGGLR